MPFEKKKDEHGRGLKALDLERKVQRWKVSCRHPIQTFNLLVGDTENKMMFTSLTSEAINLLLIMCVHVYLYVGLSMSANVNGDQKHQIPWSWNKRWL